MVSVHSIAVSALLCVLYISQASSQECPANSVKIKACVNAFNLVNGAAKNATATSCPTDKLMDSCRSFSAMKKCVDWGNDATASAVCKTMITKELKDDNIMCTFDEIDKIKMKDCGASAIAINIALLGVTAVLAFFKF